MKTTMNFPRYMDFPEYATEAAKMEKLKTNLQSLIAKKAEMSKVNQENDAAARLRGENIESLIESGDFSQSSIGARYTADDFARNNSQAHMLEQAIAQHQITLDKLKNTIHPKQLKDVRKTYGELVKKITQSYASIAKLHEEENDIVNALEAEDIRYWGVMPRIHTSNIGYASNEYAWIHFFLKEAEQQGYIRAKDYFK